MKQQPDAQVLYVGTKHGLEADLVPKGKYRICYITSTRFTAKTVFRYFSNYGENSVFTYKG